MPTVTVQRIPNPPIESVTMVLSEAEAIVLRDILGARVLGASRQVHSTNSIFNALVDAIGPRPSSLDPFTVYTTRRSPRS